MSPNEIVLLVLSALVAIFTLMSIGGNDVANSQGTAVGSGALSIRGAQIIAGICEFAGAALVGHHVSNTIGNKMVGETNVSDLQLCWGMFSALLAVGIWMMIATKIKMPVSGTHSIVGAVFGLNLVITHFNFSKIEWAVFGKVGIAWLVTPLLSFVTSYFSLKILNIWWPPDKDRDDAVNKSESLINYENKSETRENSSVLSFLMAKPGVRMTPIPTPSPKRLGKKTDRLTWSDANKCNDEDNVNNINIIKMVDDHDIDIDIKDKTKNINGEGEGEFNNNNNNNNNDDEWGYFEPSKFKFALIFGILLATLIVFIMVGGPKSINIKDGNLQVESWIIVVISFSALIFFVVIGYLIEGCYRKSYVRLVYTIKSQNDNKNDVERDNQNDIEAIEMKTQEKTKSVAESNCELFNNQDYFRLYLIIACGAVDFAQGGNDVANVIGPFGQIFKYTTTGSIEGEQNIPVYIAAGAGISIALGFVLFGGPVLETIGKSITTLSYRSGFVAQFCSASTVLVCNVLGLPVSSSTVIVGGVSGVGYYNSKHANDNNNNMKEEEDVEYVGCCNKIKYLWQKQQVRILCKILAIWIITIPANAILAGSLFAFINIFL